MNNTSHEVLLAKLKTHRLTIDVIENVLLPYDLSVNEWLLLTIIRSRPSIAMNELATQLSVTKPLVTRLTKSLAKKSYLQLRTTADKRRKQLILTDRSQEVLEQAEPQVRLALREWLSDFEPEHIAIYISIVLAISAREQ